MKVLILHAYNAKNLGDGLLVRETLRLVTEAFHGASEITILASHPRTFDGVNATVIDSSFTRLGYRREYLRTLRAIDSFDLVLGVGGGYLRGGNVIEFLKSSLVHGPQLLAAARRAGPVVYLPQSVGPYRLGTSAVIRSLLSRIDHVLLRDDRSVIQFDGPTVRRFPDLALVMGDSIVPSSDPVDEIPVLSVRSVHGAVPTPVHRLADRMETFDTYVQSSTSGNDDRPATAALGARRELAADELMTGRPKPRVVVAVRLHAALMALRAGHYVVHLAYERKGFGAFDDLGIPEFVHNVNGFNVDLVYQQVSTLVASSEARSAYRDAVLSTTEARRAAHEGLVDIVRCGRH